VSTLVPGRLEVIVRPPVINWRNDVGAATDDVQ
jgi:hypothetical protein